MILATTPRDIAQKHIDLWHSERPWASNTPTLVDHVEAAIKEAMALQAVDYAAGLATARHEGRLEGETAAAARAVA